MKSFLAIYVGTPQARSKWDTLSEAERKQRQAHHPHFTIFPGDSVEIMECLPLPTQ